MRIVLCTQQFGNYWSGLGSYATIIAKGLSDREIDLTIITPGDPVNGLDCQYVKVSPSASDPTHGGWFSLSKQYARALKEIDADLIHFTDAREAYSYSGQIPAVGTLHDDYFARHRWVPWFYRQHYVDWMKRYAYYSFVNFTERKALRKLKALIANSDATGATIARRYGIDTAKMETIYIQPDLKPAQLDPDTEELRLKRKKLLFVGGNIQRKGLPLVLEAMQSLIIKHPEIQLDILGKNQNLGRMEQLAGKMGVKEYVNFKGWVPPEEIAKQYRDASIFLMPSLMEGYGLVYLEAMAQGLPVVAGDVGGTRELVRHLENGLLVDPQDSMSLQKSISTLLTDKDSRARVIEGGYRTVAGLDINQMVDQTLAFYERSVGGRT